jgi:hypothetical protein
MVDFEEIELPLYHSEESIEDIQHAFQDELDVSTFD